jgi:hypothetical protein
MEGISALVPGRQTYEICALIKSANTINRDASERTTRPTAGLYRFLGAIRRPHAQRGKVHAHVYGDYTRRSWIYLTRTRTELYERLRKWQTTTKRQRNEKCRVYNPDIGVVRRHSTVRFDEKRKGGTLLAPAENVPLWTEVEDTENAQVQDSTMPDGNTIAVRAPPPEPREDRERQTPSPSPLQSPSPSPSLPAPPERRKTQARRILDARDAVRESSGHQTDTGRNKKHSSFTP